MLTPPPDLHSAALETTAALDALPPTDGDAGAAPEARRAPGRYLALADGEEQRLLALSRPITHIGRGFTATIQLEDPGVSRRHAILTQRRDSVRILDDRSSNGTFVNGRRILEAELHDGDVIVIGGVVLVYVDMPG
jgi:pSer/pThr/pTyr-binding forkhead associated (FHA) protein